MKKLKIVILAISLFLIVLSVIMVKINIKIVNKDIITETKNHFDFITKDTSKAIIVDRIIINSDKNGNSILDLDEMVIGARIDAKNKPVYTSKYYVGGYPPDNEGVCTDVIWRAFMRAGYNLKEMIDKDIKANVKQYPRVAGKPDSNIDFRRVPNLVTFFTRNAQVLTLELNDKDVNNLKQWQGGDIVTFDNPQHVVMISDKRKKDGTPFIIHNAGPYTVEEDELLKWMPKITGHFRYPKESEIKN